MSKSLITLLVSAVVFVPQQNDKYFDLCGTAGWMSTAFISLYGPSLKAKFWDGIQRPWPSLSSFPPHKLMLTAAVAFWSLKLGGFLVMVFTHIMNSGCLLTDP